MKNKKTAIMGILNMTPDSFSDGGSYINKKDAIKQVEKMIREGATIIDIGGESTKPNAKYVDAEEETNRIVPIIKQIKSQFDILISVDTYKPEVAKKAIEAGADIINDVWGGSKDPQMLELVAETKIPYIAMHNQKDKQYNNLIEDIDLFFETLITYLNKADYPMERLILDPGIGFAKTHEDNVCIMQNLEHFQKFECKLLLGTSRKSMIGNIVNEDNPQKRIVGTCITSAEAVRAGYDIVRVHDVKENCQAIEMAEVLYNSSKNLVY